MKCFHILTLYPDGHVGRCDELGVHDDTVALVDVGTGSVVESDPHGEEDFLEKVHRLNMKCEACSYREVCRGGCVAARLRYQGTEYDYEYCAQRAALIDCIASGIGAPPILKQVPVIGPFE
jgi:uncharacterized protein